GGAGGGGAGRSRGAANGGGAASARRLFRSAARTRMPRSAVCSKYSYIPGSYPIAECSASRDRFGRDGVRAREELQRRRMLRAFELAVHQGVRELGRGEQDHQD